MASRYFGIRIRNYYFKKNNIFSKLNKVKPRRKQRIGPGQMFDIEQEIVCIAPIVEQLNLADYLYPNAL